MADSIPAPPPGFQLQQSGGIPAPPPGFQMDVVPDDVVAAAGQNATRQQLSDAFYKAKQSGDEQTAMHIMGQIQRQGLTLAPMSAQQQDAAFQKANDANVASMSPVQKFLAGAGKSFVDTARGVGQLTGLESQQDIDNANQNDAALMRSGLGKVGDFVGTGAQLAVPVGGEEKLAEMGLAKAAPYLVAAGKSAAFAGAQPVQGGGSRALNAMEGGVAGAAGQAVSPVARWLGGKFAPNVSAAKQAGIDLAQQYGIPLHLSQVTDSKPLQTIASAAKYLPFSGNRAAQQAQQGAFNRALSNQIGQDSSSLSDDVLGKAAQQISNGYDDLFGRTNVKLGPQTVSKLGALWKQSTQDLPPDQAQVVQNQITKYFDAAQTNGGTIPGRLYQNIRAGLQNVERGNQPAAHMVGQVRKAMQDAADNSMGGNDAAALKKLNGQYNSLKILQKAVNNRAAGAGGDVSPANLWSLANSRYGSTPEMRDLAKLGQTVLKDPIPDSGTAARNLVYGGLGVGGFAAPHTVLPAVGAGMTLGRALNSPMVARQLPYIGQNALGLLSRGAARVPYLPAAYLETARAADATQP